jgi:hypothetical protein
MPADASELYSAAPPPPVRAYKRPSGSSRLVLIATVTFALGAACGVGGVLAFQAIDWSPPRPDQPEIATAAPDETARPTAPSQPALAPMPREGGIKPIVVEPDPDGDFQLPQPPPPAGRVTTFEVNQPDGTFAVPFPMKKGEHVVLKGRVRMLRVSVLDNGATLDASELEASVVTISSKIDIGSTLKVRVPNGTVHVSGKIDNKSHVEINAPAGDVKFMVTTTSARDGSKIDNGSTVAITARTVEFKGDISGADTKVSVTLTRNAWLKFTAITGKATLEYKSQMAGWSPPDVVVGTVARTATFRKLDAPAGD